MRSINSILNTNTVVFLVMQSVQEKVAEEVIAEFKKDPSIVGIELCGSLARGEVRANSDVDFGVISTSAEEHQFVEEYRNGIKVDISITPLSLLLEMVDTHPFLLHDALWVKIVYDPQGVLKQTRTILEIYYEQHPEIVRFWEENLEQYRDAKRTGRNPRGYQSVLDEAEMRFSESKTITRKFFPRE
ncbi:MAG: nucleotidyltransferase domain-containing protein [Candidatus Thorarchaeota archaeon]|jgi:predicted nucleotidyltransferase